MASITLLTAGLMFLEVYCLSSHSQIIYSLIDRYLYEIDTPPSGYYVSLIIVDRSLLNGKFARSFSFDCYDSIERTDVLGVFSYNNQLIVVFDTQEARELFSVLNDTLFVLSIAEFDPNGIDDGSQYNVRNYYIFDFDPNVENLDICP